MAQICSYRHLLYFSSSPHSFQLPKWLERGGKGEIFLSSSLVNRKGERITIHHSRGVGEEGGRIEINPFPPSLLPLLAEIDGDNQARKSQIKLPPFPTRRRDFYFLLLLPRLFSPRYFTGKSCLHRCHFKTRMYVVEPAHVPLVHGGKPQFRRLSKSKAGEAKAREIMPFPAGTDQPTAAAAAAAAHPWN